MRINNADYLTGIPGLSKLAVIILNDFCSMQSHEEDFLGESSDSEIFWLRIRQNDADLNPDPKHCSELFS